MGQCPHKSSLRNFSRCLNSNNHTFTHISRLLFRLALLLLLTHCVMDSNTCRPRRFEVPRTMKPWQNQSFSQELPYRIYTRRSFSIRSSSLSPQTMSQRIIHSLISKKMAKEFREELKSRNGKNLGTWTLVQDCTETSPSPSSTQRRQKKLRRRKTLPK